MRKIRRLLYRTDEAFLLTQHENYKKITGASVKGGTEKCTEQHYSRKDILWIRDT